MPGEKICAARMPANSDALSQVKALADFVCEFRLLFTLRFFNEIFANCILEGDKVCLPLALMRLLNDNPMQLANKDKRCILNGLNTLIARRTLDTKFALK
jgi:hypothetical protein